jgi:AcrR family transcriptional regulator
MLRVEVDPLRELTAGQCTVAIGVRFDEVGSDQLALGAIRVLRLSRSKGEHGEGAEDDAERGDELDLGSPIHPLASRSAALRRLRSVPGPSAGPGDCPVVLSLKMTIVDSETEAGDGRFARSRRTRAAVAQAMLDCLEEGHLRPSAEQVAAKAGVSARAVFRHFDRMEALLEEVALLQMRRIIPRLPPVEREGPLEARVASLVEYTTRLNELIEPVRRASMLAEPFSPVIQAAQRMMRRETRRQIRAALAPELEALPEAPRDELVKALRALFSFSYWQELRRYDGQSGAATRRSTATMVEAVLRAAEQR